MVAYWLGRFHVRIENSSTSHAAPRSTGRARGRCQGSRSPLHSLTRLQPDTVERRIDGNGCARGQNPRDLRRYSGQTELLSADSSKICTIHAWTESLLSIKPRLKKRARQKKSWVDSGSGSLPS